jgi:hydroxymethylglutaryl-CoA lyase
MDKPVGFIINFNVPVLRQGGIVRRVFDSLRASAVNPMLKSIGMGDVKIIECPRDAWQGLKGQIPIATKVAYLRALIAVGFKHIDAVSFVSPKAIPQMADSEQVLEELDPPDDVEIIGIVVNQKGADRAIATEAVQTLGFPYSVSPTFLERNQSQSLEQAADELEQIKLKADAAGLGVVAYVSMAFGNPYGDLWNTKEVVEAVAIIADMGIEQISLADTVGLATPAQVQELVAAVTSAYDHLEIGAHLHGTRAGAADKVIAAYNAGCRRFDSAIGGLGGCPFAQDVMVGNIPTEIAVAALATQGADVLLKKPLDSVIAMSADIAKKFTVIM